MHTPKPNFKIGFSALAKPSAIDLPFSKSIANRLIILHASVMHQIAIAKKGMNNDILLMQNAVISLYKNEPINAGDAGSVLRFMTSLAANTPGFENEIYGDPRLMERPIKPLIDLLISLDAEIEWRNDRIWIKGKKLVGGKTITFDTMPSSQIITSLLLTASQIREGLTFVLPKKQQSFSYINLTFELFKKLNVEFHLLNNSIEIPYQPHLIISPFELESDWSAASFFMCYAALGNKVVLNQLTLKSKQSEILLLHWMKKHEWIAVKKQDNALLFSPLQANFPEIVDFSEFPDAAMNVIITMVLLQKKKFTATGLQTLHTKESNRLQVLIAILQQLNVAVIKVSEDVIKIDSDGLSFNNDLTFDTYNDHRVAMAVSLIALKTEININETGCIDKSFPYFWDEIKKLGFKIL